MKRLNYLFALPFITGIIMLAGCGDDPPTPMVEICEKYKVCGTYTIDATGCTGTNCDQFNGETFTISEKAYSIPAGSDALRAVFGKNNGIATITETKITLDALSGEVTTAKVKFTLGSEVTLPAARTTQSNFSGGYELTVKKN